MCLPQCVSLGIKHSSSVSQCFSPAPLPDDHCPLAQGLPIPIILFLAHVSISSSDCSRCFHSHIRLFQMFPFLYWRTFDVSITCGKLLLLSHEALKTKAHTHTTLDTHSCGLWINQWLQEHCVVAGGTTRGRYCGRHIYDVTLD